MSLVHRASLALLSTALAVSLASSGQSAQAAAASPSSPAGHGGTWLAAQPTGGLIHNPNFGGFDDYGLTIDTVFALQAIGGHRPRSALLATPSLPTSTTTSPAMRSVTRGAPTPAPRQAARARAGDGRRPDRLRWRQPGQAAQRPGHDDRPGQGPDRRQDHVRRLREHHRPDPGRAWADHGARAPSAALRAPSCSSSSASRATSDSTSRSRRPAQAELRQEQPGRPRRHVVRRDPAVEDAVEATPSSAAP